MSSVLMFRPLLWAMLEVGTKEIPGAKSSPRIIDYRKLAKLENLKGDDGAVAWCAIFENASYEANGIPGTGSGMARSFERSDKFFALSGPVFGCTVTFWRGSKKSGLGHVGKYVGETSTHVRVLGANQGDAVSYAMFPKEGKTMGVTGYWWPFSVPLVGKPGPYPVKNWGSLDPVTVT